MDPHIPQKIIKEGKRVAGITHKLLDFSRQTAGSPEPVVLQTLLEDTLGLTVALLNKDGIRVSLDLAESPLMLMADKSSLQQIFFGLISNARFALNQKYAGFQEGKKLVITLESIFSPGRKVAKIIFRDQGTGIPPELLPKVFDPFFSTKPPGEGMGMGLSVVLGLIQKISGKIWIESQPGQWTRVTMELPVEQGDA